MRVRRLTTPAELEQFRERFMSISQERSAGAISGAVPLDYLERSTVMGVFQRGRMVAGYVLGTTQPLRVLDRFIPNNAEVDWPSGFDADHCSEVVCAWREPEFSAARMTGLIAPLGFFQSVLTGTRHMLGVCQHRAIHEHYQRLGGRCVWHGTSPDGLETWVYAVPRWARMKILLGLLLIAGPQRWLASRKDR